MKARQAGGHLSHWKRSAPEPCRRRGSVLSRERNPSPELLRNSTFPDGRGERPPLPPNLSIQSRLDQATATVRLAPSARTILTWLPAGASGPATRQTVSSIRTVPEPPTIGFSSVN